MDKSILKNRKLNIYDLTAAALFVGLFIYLVCSALRAGTISDEAFYISVPYRLMNGDGLFTDEWHLSQLASVLTYIPTRLFIAFTGTTEGIILFFRILFALFQLAVSAYTYTVLRKNGIWAVIIGSSYMVFSVIGLNTLSYNTMGLGFLILCAVSVYSATECPSRIKMLLSGSFMAAFILCQPFGVIYYALYFIAFIVLGILYDKKKRSLPYPFRKDAFLMTVTGILPVFAFFLYLLLKNSDIETIIRCIPGILSDPEHMVVSERMGVETFSGLAYFSDMTMAAGLIPLIILAVSVLLSLVISKASRIPSVLIACAGLCAFTAVFYYRLFLSGGTTETDDINFFFLPFALSGIVFFFLCKKKNYPAFVLFWCTGLVYSVLMTVSSNLALHASVNGYFLSYIGTLIFAGDLIKEIKEEEKSPISGVLIAALVTAFAVLPVFNTGATVTNTVLSRNTYKSAEMTRGVYKGISLPSDQAFIYNNIYADVSMLKEKLSPDSRVFVLENASAAYLDGELSMGSFSGWFIAEQLAFPETQERFYSYYSINPENIPDFVYVPSVTYTITGLKSVPAKLMAEYALNIFDGNIHRLQSGVYIEVTGLKSGANDKSVAEN